MIFPGKVDVTSPLRHFPRQYWDSPHFCGIRHFQAQRLSWRQHRCAKKSLKSWVTGLEVLPRALREAKNSTKRSKHVQSCPCLPCKNDGKWWNTMTSMRLWGSYYPNSYYPNSYYPNSYTTNHCPYYPVTCPQEDGSSCAVCAVYAVPARIAQCQSRMTSKMGSEVDSWWSLMIVADSW